MYTGRNTPFLSHYYLSRVCYTFSHKNAWIIIKTYVYPYQHKKEINRENCNNDNVLQENLRKDYK